MAKKCRVTLTPEGRVELEGVRRKGKADARKLAHARILLQTDAGDGRPARTDEPVASGVNVSPRTVARARQRFVEGGLRAALLPKPTRRIYARVLGGAQEAHRIALACTRPPAGQRRRTLRLLAERVVELGSADAVSHKTVRRVAGRLETHHTPRPGSWLNMAEIELSALARDLPERVGGDGAAHNGVGGATEQGGVIADWQFTTADARVKLKKLYPTTDE